MNYLGHSYFSKESDDLFVTGNVLGDFFKGRTERIEGPIKLVEGIVYHRLLDKTTDENTYIKKSKDSLIDCGLYKGVVIDIFSDYFFAKNWNKLSSSSLWSHTQRVYDQIDFSYDYLNQEAQKSYFYIKRDNVLYNYKNIEFIEDVFYKMSNFTKKGLILRDSFKYLKNDENFYEDNFFNFINSFSSTVNQQ